MIQQKCKDISTSTKSKTKLLKLADHFLELPCFISFSQESGFERTVRKALNLDCTTNMYRVKYGINYTTKM